MAYSDFEKAEAFKDTLEVTFQENVEPYCDDKIEEVENVVCNYFDNFTTLTPPLTSPIEVRGIIKRLQNRKAAGRNSPLSLENKVILYKQVLRPIITYASPVWGAAAATHMKKIQVIQNKILRLITNAPWYVRNDVIHYDLHMEPISSYITKLARNVFRSIENHDNPIIRAQTMFTYPHPKLKYAYATAKWQLPLKPP
ncbi:putative RNA-directed DNA polymerase from transposon X-element [Trichonephila clavipes]|nr:putative RNA-directed DNA polymerase from transposon X-element [Trichonephila clavipes]